MRSTHVGHSIHSSLHTLIVDDNSTNLRILERTLKHHFSHIISCKDIAKASDGDDALEAFGKRKFDLILLDIDMPTISGVEVAREIRKTNEDVIIIACTTSDSLSARELYWQTGMDGCVAKPLDLREVEDALVQALQSRTHLDLYREGRPIAKAPSKFRSHHGSLPAIALEQCQVVLALPAILSDSGLQDIHVFNSFYFEGLTQEALQVSQRIATIDDGDDDSNSLMDSDTSPSSSTENLKALHRTRSDSLHNLHHKRPRHAQTKSDPTFSSLAIFDSPATLTEA